MENEFLIKKENIIVDLNANSVEDVINKIIRKLYENNSISDMNEFKKAVMERENQMSTSIGKKVAIPHGKSSAVKKSAIFFAKLKEEIIWGGEKVKYVFMLAVNDNDKGDQHIKILANLAEKLMDDNFIINIKKAKNIEEVYAVINN